MRVYINREPVSGPQGGGNKLVTALVNKFAEEGHEVVHRLQPGIDLLLCFDPRPASWGESGNDILKYRKSNVCKLASRVGNCGSHGKKPLTVQLLDMLPQADRIIYPSHWALSYLCTAAIQMGRATDAGGIASRPYTIIPNAPMKEFYEHRNTNEQLPNDRPIRVVTHHWSNNPKKGFELYTELDKSDLEIEFTYIGNTPKGVQYERQLEPMTTEQLAIELPKHDIYLTASMEEAGANHVLEAMACGLPVVFSSTGGSIVEYCAPYGVMYHGWDFETMSEGISQIANDYDVFKQACLMYNNNVEAVASRYVELLTQ